MPASLTDRARIHATLGEPNRLAIVDALRCCDRTPRQLAQVLGLSSNLLAHHLDVLEEAGLIERRPSAADRRRRYARLLPGPLATLAAAPLATPAGSLLFVCTHNSARSQLAAALWTDRTGRPAASAGTEPADRVHPRAVTAAARAGLDLSGAEPRRLTDFDVGVDAALSEVTVITVCDRANEELCSPAGWWHWSTPDPAAIDTDDAFDATIDAIDQRIAAFGDPDKEPTHAG